MISADSSVIIAYLQGEKGKDIERLHEAFISYSLILPPVVISELLSDPHLPPKNFQEIVASRMFEINHGYWMRAGLMRSTLMQKKLKAGLSDVLIAQSCIDHDVTLITRDRDFHHFVKYFGLKIYE